MALQPNTTLLTVDVFLERQTLNKNRGGALCTGPDGPRAGAGQSAAGARRGGALCTGADGPQPGVMHGGALCTGTDGLRPGARLGLLPDGRTVRALGPDGPRPRAGRSARAQARGGGRSPAAPGSRSREGPSRGGEILGVV
jgi:hypothetical protein